MARIQCYQLFRFSCLTVIAGLCYLSLYLFYRNSTLKKESVSLYVALDECKWGLAHETLIKDEEIKLAKDEHSTEWEQYLTLLRNRQDRRKIHRKDRLDSQEIPNCHNCYVYNLETEIGEKYDCATLKVIPEIPICLYKDWQDADVSAAIRQRGVWQEECVLDFQRWLARDTDLGLIDVGCYIGVYSLAAAALGRNVLAVDPRLENLKHLHKSLQIGQPDADVTILHNAISDTRGKAQVTAQVNNKAESEVIHINQSSPKLSEDGSVEVVETILLNDLTSFWQFKKALFRIDLNGLEHRAFSSAELLFENAFIPLVMMKWEKMKRFYWLPMANRDRMMVESMINFFLEMDYTPLNWNKHVLLVQVWDLWPADVLWVHKTFQF